MGGVIKASPFFMTESEIEEALKPGSYKIQYNIDNATALFTRAYKFVNNNDVCPTCPEKLYNAYIELKNNYKQKLTFKMENQKKYTIRKGAVIDSFNAKTPELRGGIWTSANITDDVAEMLLKEGIGTEAILNADGSVIEKKGSKEDTHSEKEIKESKETKDTKKGK